MPLPIIAEGAIAAAPVVYDAGKTVARKALQLAKQKAPSAYAAARDYFTKSKQNVDVLADSKSQQTQAAIVSTLLKNGLPADLLKEEGQLTDIELRQYAQIFAKFHKAEYAAVDQAAVSRPSTGDGYLDQLAVNLEIEDICVGMGISSDMYAKLLRGVRLHTTKDIERFQLDRRMRRMKAV